MEKRSMFVGMDVHKESIDISLAEEGRDGEVRHVSAFSRGALMIARRRRLQAGVMLPLASAGCEAPR